jgi:hypothetical protein
VKFTIAKNVPLPINTRALYPFRDMKVGDSFYIPGNKQYMSAVSASFNFAKSNAPYKFSSRQEGDGGRIWRVK